MFARVHNYSQFACTDTVPTTFWPITSCVSRSNISTYPCSLSSTFKWFTIWPVYCGHKHGLIWLNHKYLKKVGLSLEMHTRERAFQPVFLLSRFHIVFLFIKIGSGIKDVEINIRTSSVLIKFWIWKSIILQFQKFVSLKHIAHHINSINIIDRLPSALTFKCLWFSENSKFSKNRPCSSSSFLFASPFRLRPLPLGLPLHLFLRRLRCRRRQPNHALSLPPTVPFCLPLALPRSSPWLWSRCHLPCHRSRHCNLHLHPRLLCNPPPLYKSSRWRSRWNKRWSNRWSSHRSSRRSRQRKSLCRKNSRQQHNRQN